MNMEAHGQASSIAWYKLAELVNRGEKEKVLSLYRLLSHSFDDKAYALQLEGDILWSFEDRQALEKYQQAAFLYKKSQNLISAVAIYEHLCTLEPHYYELYVSLLEFYILLDSTEKFAQWVERLGAFYSEDDEAKKPIEQVFRTILEMVKESERRHASPAITVAFVMQIIQRSNAHLAYTLASLTV